jgi:hypothetical protein
MLRIKDDVPPVNGKPQMEVSLLVKALQHTLGVLIILMKFLTQNLI